MGKRLTVALAIFALVAVPLAIYVAGYFLLGERNDFHHSGGGNPTGTMTIQRTYPQQWMAVIYRPTGRVEKWARGAGVDVDVLWIDELSPLSPSLIIPP